MESAYNFTEYRYRFLKESKESFHAGSKGSKFVVERVQRDSELTGVKDTFLELIRQDIVHKKINIKDIILRCISMSYEVYREETKRLSREVFDLGCWLREAQQRNKEITHDVIKKVKEAEQREQIILEKNEKIRKVSQEVESIRLKLKKAKSSTKNNHKGKGVDRQTKIQVDQLPIEKIDISLYSNTLIEMLMYDIPARWKEDKIIAIFKNLGLVKKISIKNQFKYKLVKMVIYLKVRTGKCGVPIRNMYTERIRFVYILCTFL
ncbi:hypothetical protein RhiirA4_480047 [Rhizophagus irregularis]|uniref:Uncharacterized protein n=1 Tax=Rhizophagus irregularis TaxID=588596 RepID=A0A2I1HHC3_9GLOM|nr:hypothetical protein RhiirA4_480047 [Rhizophagus irregularis]